MPRLPSVVALLLPIALLVSDLRAQRPASTASIITIDASRFVGVIPRGHVITDAAALRVPWVFDNTALEMRTNHNYVIRAAVP
jgi:hypothetical protein